MPANTESRRSRKQDALFSACFHSGLLLASAVFLLYVSGALGSPWRALVRFVSVSELGMIIPIWISFKIRIKESDGGEEDAAAQY